MAEGSPVISRRAAAAFTAPAAALVGVFLLFPAVWVLAIGLTDLTLTSVEGPRFVGAANFVRVLKDHFFVNALKVSGLFVLGSGVIGQAGLGLAMALLLREERGWLKGALTGAAVCAWILPEVVVAYCWAAYLDREAGLLNGVLGLAGVGPVGWLQDHALLAIIVFNTWRGTAFSMLLFTAALASIPPSYWETAEVLGASGWRRFRDVVLPMIRGALFTDLILITLWTFNLFTPFLLTRGGPSFATELVPIYIYRTAFLGTFKLGLGSAAAAIMLLINLALGLGYLAAGRSKR